MSIWNLSTGENATENTSTEHNSSNNFEPMPHNSKHNTIVTDAKWDEYEGERFISVTHTVISGEFEKRKVFQKIKIFAEKETSKDNAIKMLVAMNNIAEADLTSKAEFTNDDLQEAFMNKCFQIQVQVWKINDNTGNWVNAVAKRADDDQLAADNEAAMKAMEGSGSKKALF